MYDSGAEPKPLLPFLEPLYRAVVPLSWLLVRVAVGGILLVHGYSKIGHVDAVVANMVKQNLAPPDFIAYLVTLTETVGAAGVVLGLFTRFCAAACAIDLGVIAFHVFLPRSFALGEFPLLWGAVMLAVALRGGGPYSLDRLIGREL